MKYLLAIGIMLDLPDYPFLLINLKKCQDFQAQGEHLTLQFFLFYYGIDLVFLIP